ncbi:STAS domain-containing protein [Trichlorobacter ammonificans]|uniref:Anti-sigma factor antagonist n=1 Tax=Trichlorobacter ammonificans TaxID=2916410 RepID=A0ABN8HFJ6_9BACT|nr:STAS domain-containing protein [Trichlorobacter ammonificans]CAH2031614.1 Anti-sigma factor antagonist [Trichlorobacter ammonificans]
MDAYLQITTQHRGGATVALLAGRLDADQVPVLERWFDEQLDGCDLPVVLDFAGLSYISSSGLRQLLAMAKELKQRQRRFLICGLFGMVREVFMVSGFLESLEVQHTVDDALAALGG